MNKHLFLLVSLAFLSLANLGMATTLYWDGGTSNITTNGDGVSQGGAGTWDTTLQNWDQGLDLAHLAWDNAQNYDGYFAGQAGIVTVGTAVMANSITFNTTNGYVISDGGNAAYTLTLNAATNNSSATIGANVVNSTTFSTYGSSSLTLTNTSSGLTGGLAVNGGTLQLGNGAASSPGPSGFGDVTVAANATFRINPGSASSYAQNISGAGSLYAQANSYTTAITLSGANTFTGNVTVNQGNLTVFSISDTTASGLGLGTNVTIGASTSASSSYLTYTGYGDTTTRTITLDGTTSATKLINANGFAPLVLLGPLAFGNTNKHTLTLSGTSTYFNIFGGTIADNTSTNTAVAKSGAGLWMLAGTNTYSGGTLLNGGGGTLVITNDYALGAVTGAVTFAGAVTLKSASNNVTLGALRTVTVSTNITASFGVVDAKNFYIPSFITGLGSVTKGSASTSLGWVRFSNDTNNYTGDFGMGYGNAEFTSVADQGMPSSLGQGAAGTSGRITLGNSTSAGVLRYVGAGNSATHRPLYWTSTIGGFTLDNTNTGTIAWLNTAQLVNGAGSKALTLTGSNTGTNTLAHLINDNGGVTSLNKSGAGKWVLGGANTYSGVTTISGGTLSVSTDANLGTTPASPANTLTLNGGALSASASFTLNANRGIVLGPTGLMVSGRGTIDVTAGQTLTYGGVMANSTSTNMGGLIKTSPGTLTLSGVNTYTGDTTISNGVLALSGSGSIANSTNLIIDAGATCDVSGVGGGYALNSGQMLYATNGATVTINGSLNLGSASLVMTNVPHTPTITVTGGTLTLASGNAFTVNVNNGGNKLTAGSYKLIAKGAGGSVVGTAPAAVTVGGDGLATDATAALSISDGELYLVVTGGTLYPPVVESFGLGGGGVVLSFSGTNGQSWKILTSTNLTKPLADWDVATSGTFAGGTVSYTNTSVADPQRYYRITSP